MQELVKARKELLTQSKEKNLLSTDSNIVYIFLTGS